MQVLTGADVGISLSGLGRSVVSVSGVDCNDSEKPYLGEMSVFENLTNRRDVILKNSPGMDWKKLHLGEIASAEIVRF